MLNQELNVETNQELNLQRPFSDQTTEQETMQPDQDEAWLTDQLNDQLEDAVDRACNPLIGTVPRKDLLWTAIWRIICPDMSAGFSGVTLWLLMASSGAAITSRLRTRKRRGMIRANSHSR